MGLGGLNPPRRTNLEHLVSSVRNPTIYGFLVDLTYPERSAWVTLVLNATVYRTFA